MGEELETVLEPLEGEVIKPEIVGDPIDDGTPEDLTPTEQKAWDSGWRPQDQFQGKPGNWRPPGEYILFGEMQRENESLRSDQRRQSAEFEERFANVNKMHQAQQASAIAALKEKQREAVEEQDIVRFDSLQKQIDTQPDIIAPTTKAPAKDPAILDWEAKNPWVNDPASVQGQDAIALYNSAASKPGATIQSSLAHVDKRMALLYPDELPNNPRRSLPTMGEQSRSPSRANRRNPKGLTMSDLTIDEKRDYENFGREMFKDTASFLKTVEDGRKESKL